MDGKGPAFYTTGNLDSYLDLKPATATEASGGGNGTWLIAVIVAAVAAALIVWLVLRRRPKAEEA